MDLLPILVLLIVFLIMLTCGLLLKKYFKKKPTKVESEEIIKTPKNPKIEFIDQDYFNYIVDNAQYFNRMNELDLIARDASNINSYKKLYKDGYKGFSDMERNILISLTNKLNDILKDKCKNIYSIPWKFAKLDYNLEKGYPHTHSDVIVLTTVFFGLDKLIMLETLLHEKIHVYQRLYPLYTQNLISLWNFKLIDRFENYKDARNNPDINNFVYSQTNSDKAFLQVYNSPQPTSISDSAVYFYIIKSKDEKQKENIVTKQNLNIPDIVTQYEHPYEIMATFLPKIIIHNYNDGSKDGSNFTKDTFIWLDTHS